MALVSSSLIEKHISSDPLLSRAWRLLISDPEVNSLLEMSNINTVKRLLYNDHGPLHAKIVSGSALEILDILLEAGVQPSSLVDNVVDNLSQAKLIVLLAAYLHDIGNSIHRINHELIGALTAKQILDRLLPDILASNDQELITRIEAEVMHAIYATSPNIEALTIEASIVKVADSTDMAEGRARIPYKSGKTDIHAVSALSIKKVEIEPGSVRPLRIKVIMKNPAGLFQIEKVLLPKVKTSLIEDYVEIVPIVLKSNEIQLEAIYP